VMGERMCWGCVGVDGWDGVVYSSWMVGCVGVVGEGICGGGGGREETGWGVRRCMLMAGKHSSMMGE
jgi:hypothetical protein